MGLNKPLSYRQLENKGDVHIKKGINIIFLDIDGVLNCKQTLERCGPYIGIGDQKIELLKELVERTKAYIVLTSSWKQFWHYSSIDKCRQDDLANYLDEAFKRHLIKVTAKTHEFNPFKRGEGIINYLNFIKGNQIMVNNYVIFDDLMFDYRQMKLLDHLIKTNSEYGLQKSHITKAISLLRTKTLK